MNYRIFFVLILIPLTFLFSCQTYKYNITDNSGNLYSPEKLLLEGQLAYDKQAYDVAIKYFMTILEKYPDNKEFTSWACYEIGFVYFSMKKYDLAKQWFTKVIEQYNGSSAAVKLAQYMLQKIEEILKSKKK
ncbi:MAG TPA: tetratricopeptide repeat protein [Exilispira sp.]|nr:tetratricopeptide repeat protein [Exilispira sp.]